MSTSSNWGERQFRHRLPHNFATMVPEPYHEPRSSYRSAIPISTCAV
jgi:hypothetical protein